MPITTNQKYIRISPQKIRVVAKAVKNLTPSEALTQLSFINSKAAAALKKALQQALANATNNSQLPINQLRFSSIEINEGPTFKRWRAVSRGRAHSIFKRTSHIKINLSQIKSTTHPTTNNPKSTNPQPKKSKKIKSQAQSTKTFNSKTKTNHKS